VASSVASFVASLQLLQVCVVRGQLRIPVAVGLAVLAGGLGTVGAHPRHRDEEVLSVEVDLDAVMTWRQQFPVLQDRRL
jgi:predicted amidohydrolase